MIGYTSYGFFKASGRPCAVISFNGEWCDEYLGGYLLGSGARIHLSALMRFSRPDSYSPFGQGWLNAYAYCSCDPINRVDPSGYVWRHIRKFLPGFKQAPKSGAGARTLINRKPYKLAKELKILKARSGEDPRRLACQMSDLLSDDWRPRKYVLGASNELVIALAGKKGNADYVSHPLLAELLSDKRVISAGTFSAGAEGKIYIHNVSGHYRPKFSDLEPMVEKVRQMGLKPLPVRIY